MRETNILTRLTAVSLAASLIILSPGVGTYQAFAGPNPIGTNAPVTGSSWAGVMGSFQGSLANSAAARFGSRSDAPLYHFAQLNFSTRRDHFMAEPVYRALEAKGVTPESFKAADDKTRESLVEAALTDAIESQYQEADSLLKAKREAKSVEDLRSIDKRLSESADRGILYLDGEYHEQVLFAKEDVRKAVTDAGTAKTKNTIEKTAGKWGTLLGKITGGTTKNRMDDGGEEYRWRADKAKLDAMEIDAKKRFIAQLDGGKLAGAKEALGTMVEVYKTKVQRGMTNLEESMAQDYSIMLQNVHTRSQKADAAGRNELFSVLKEFFAAQEDGLEGPAMREQIHFVGNYEIGDNVEDPASELELRDLIQEALRRGDKTEAYQLEQRLAKIKKKGNLTTTGAPRKKVTFADVAGQEEAKAELARVVKYMKDPSKYRKLGAKGYKGVLLIGPPGTGKTLIARAVAGETGATYIEKSGSDFVEIYVGNGAKKARDLFAEANKAAKDGPVILFIDELDAVGKARSSGSNSGNSQESDQTLNELLVQINDLHPNVVLMGATNRADTLDPALVRGGRFELKVPVGLPDVKGREGIFKVHTKNKPLAEDVDLVKAARETPGLSGADIEHVANDAAMIAAERDADKISMADIAAAIDRQGIGHERRLVMSEAERRTVAYHESGHALVSHILPFADAVRKVTIIPHGLHALGLMQAMPAEEKTLYSKNWLLDRMAVALGGRAAELLMMGESYSGAQSDLESATRIATAMVTQYGMSDKIGPAVVDPRANVSEARQQAIDDEIRSLVEQAQKRATEVLTKYKAALVKMADTLMEKETLRGEEIEAMVPSKKAAQASTAR